MQTALLTTPCAHCGAPARATRAGAAAFCCSGCAFVHSLAAADPLDTLASGDAVDAAPVLRETVLRIDGATCAACVARIESALAAIDGVREARFSLAAHRARVVADADVAAATLLAAVARAGYRARLPGRGDAEAAFDRRRSLFRLALAAFAMMQVMMFAWPAYIADEGTLTWDVRRLFDLASLAITVPVLLFSAQPIFRAAWRGIVGRQPGMDLPVAIGILVSFVASVYATFAGGDVYYDSIAMFVFFLLGARHLESAALAKTIGAVEALASLIPEQARRLRDGAWESVDPGSLSIDDRVWIGVGESAPADAVLAAGATEFDEALVTGESAPVAKRAGDLVIAGTVNLSRPVEARVVACGPDNTLERIRRLVDRAASEKPRWTQLADRVARHFAWVIVAAATLAGLVWLRIDPARAVWVAVATLVVTCPCALSLAAPAALSAALGRLARRGVLVTHARGLEVLAAVTHVVFDKTGTLTTGRLRLADLRVLGRRSREDCIALARSLESALPHPIAHALTAERSVAVTRPQDALAFPGEGVEGRIDGRRYRVGSAEFCARICSRPPPEITGTGPVALMVDENEWLARFEFEDALRPEAVAVAARLRAQGCELVLLSGDRASVVEPVARALGIASYRAGAGPDAKARHVADLAAQGATVAMVGDGVNDAPVLARAHVAIALGAGAALARSQADLVLVNPSLEALTEAIDTARALRRVIRQNLGWALGYNVIALPLALAGMLEPWIASLGMSLSSLVVIANALRLARAPRRPRAASFDLRPAPSAS